MDTRGRCSRSSRKRALERAAREVLEQKLSVRETEALAKKANEPAPVEPAPGADAEAVAEQPPDVHTRKAEETLRLSLCALASTSAAKARADASKSNSSPKTSSIDFMNTSRRDDDF